MINIIKTLLCLFLFTINLSFADIQYQTLTDLRTQNKEQVVIIGSGPAGLTAALYAARYGLSPLVLEGYDPHGQIALSELVENFPGFPDGISGYTLSENMRIQAKQFGAKFKNTTVTKVDISQKPITISLNDSTQIQTSALIIATGAKTRWLGLPLEKDLIGKGVSSCALCDGPFFKDKEVVVVGGGESALEDALFLSKYAKKVTIIHRRDQLKASIHLQNKAFAQSNIHFMWNSVVCEIMGTSFVTGIQVRSQISGVIESILCSGVFIAIGHTPNSELFKDSLLLDNENHIVTQNNTTHTSVQGVFAAGDVTDSLYRQAITASGMGCKAAVDAYKYIESNQTTDNIN